MNPRNCDAQEGNKTYFGREKKTSDSKYQKNKKFLLLGQRKIVDKRSKIPEHLMDSKNISLQHCGKFNETPKSSVSTDTEVYFINYYNIHHAPHSSIDESIVSDNDGYDTEKHVRVIRQVSSDTYCSDNCFYSDSETNKVPDIITHDNTTSNILYEMCDTLNKVPDILSGNLDSNNCQKETPCRYSGYSGTSSSSFCSGETSPNSSPNSTLQFKQWPEIKNNSETIGNDMTDTDSIIYHNVEDAHVVGDNMSSYDNLSRRSLNFMNSTIDLFNSKESIIKDSPIIRDNVNVKNNEISEYPENMISNEMVVPKKLEPKDLVNLDVLNKLDFGQIDQDIDYEVSTFLGTDLSRKIIENQPTAEEKSSTFSEYNPRRLERSDVSKTFGSREMNQTNVMNKLDHQPPKNNDTNYSMNILRSDESKSYKKHKEKDDEYKQLSKKRKNLDENMDVNYEYFSKENLKSYNLSESCSAPNIFGQNKKYRYSTSSMDEGSDYDPERSFHKFSKSISNVSLHEYRKKVLSEKQNRNKNSKEELEKIEKTVGRMLEQVRLHENLLQNDADYMKLSYTQEEKKALPFFLNLRASNEKIPQTLDEVPINCNRRPLRYKYETKNDLNVASSSNVSSACSIEDLERSVNKLLSDVKEEEYKLILSQSERHHLRKIESPKVTINKLCETEIPCKSFYHTKVPWLMENRMKKCDIKSNEANVYSESQPLTSYQGNHYSIPNEFESNYDGNYFHNKGDLKNKEDIWWEGAYRFDTPKDQSRCRNRTKRSHKRATYWPNNPYGLDRQISFTPSSEEGFSSSSNSDSECGVLKRIKNKGTINLNLINMHNGKVGIDIETADVLRTQQYPNHSLSSLWNRSMPSLPSVCSESSFPSVLSIRSSESEDCLSNLGYYQNIVIPKNCIEYITPAEIGLPDTLINSGYCHWNFNNNEGKQVLEFILILFLFIFF